MVDIEQLISLWVFTGPIFILNIMCQVLWFNNYILLIEKWCNYSFIMQVWHARSVLCCWIHVTVFVCGTMHNNMMGSWNLAMNVWSNLTSHLYSCYHDINYDIVQSILGMPNGIGGCFHLEKILASCTWIFILQIFMYHVKD